MTIICRDIMRIILDYKEELEIAERKKKVLEQLKASVEIFYYKYYSETHIQINEDELDIVKRCFCDICKNINYLERVHCKTLYGNCISTMYFINNSVYNFIVCNKSFILCECIDHLL